MVLEEENRRGNNANTTKSSFLTIFQIDRLLLEGQQLLAENRKLWKENQVLNDENQQVRDRIESLERNVSAVTLFDFLTGKLNRQSLSRFGK